MALSRRKFIQIANGFVTPLLVGAGSVAKAQSLVAALSNGTELDEQWVALGRDGKLIYKQTPRGDRIMDFSHAGYMGGGVALPDVPVKVEVTPSGGDDTAAIQAAINKVSAMPFAGAQRGAVQLGRGTFRCRGTIKISQSGVVLKGAGSDPAGTTIELTGEPHRCIDVKAADGNEEVFEADAAAVPVRIVDDYVPSGSCTLTLSDTSGLKAGDCILIRRPITAKWVAFMGMDTLVRDGKKQTWIRPGKVMTFERKVQAIQGQRITLDLPLSDCIDADFTGQGGATVVKAAPDSRLTQIGIEGIRLISPLPQGDLSARKFDGIEFKHCTDGWVRDVSSHNPVTVVSVRSVDCNRITLQRIACRHDRPIEKGLGYPADFLVQGARVLMDRCSVEGDWTFFYSSLGLGETAAVILDCDFKGNSSIQPHMRWNSGLLVDSCRVPEGGISFQNRKTAGSGHGWTIGWAVAWNCVAKWYQNEQPPGAVNWVIGCSGKQQSGENFLSHEKRVRPASLYLAQLRERLGDQAVRNIGRE